MNKRAKWWRTFDVLGRFSGETLFIITWICCLRELQVNVATVYVYHCIISKRRHAMIHNIYEEICKEYCQKYIYYNPKLYEDLRNNLSMYQCLQDLKFLFKKNTCIVFCKAHWRLYSEDITMQTTFTNQNSKICDQEIQILNAYYNTQHSWS